MLGCYLVLNDLNSLGPSQFLTSWSCPASEFFTDCDLYHQIYSSDSLLSVHHLCEVVHYVDQQFQDQTPLGRSRFHCPPVSLQVKAEECQVDLVDVVIMFIRTLSLYHYQGMTITL